MSGATRAEDGEGFPAAGEPVLVHGLTLHEESRDWHSGAARKLSATSYQSFTDSAQGAAPAAGRVTTLRAARTARLLRRPPEVRGAP